jgi:site-specific DNA-methyltransferase (adenine-specific)
MKANKIEEVALVKIKPYWRNARDNSATIDALKKSITQYGFNVPLVVDKNYVLITGHARYKALLQLKYEKVTCIITDLNEQKVKEYRIADNKLSELANWDTELLEQELREIKDIDGMQDFFPDLDLNSFFNESVGQKITPIDSIEVHKQEGKLKGQFDEAGNNNRTIVEIPCPHCGEPIYLDRGELEDKLDG